MSITDVVAVVIYLVAVLVMGWFLGRSNKTGDDYFTAHRSMPWYAIGFSVGATFISAGTFIGGPGWSYYDGLIVAMIQFAVPIGLFVATYAVIPIFYHTGVTTVYEYIRKRFGPRTQLLNVGLWMFSALVQFGGWVYLPSLAMVGLTGISLKFWIPVIVTMSILYTVSGGIKAVMWSDVMQGCILIIGVFISFYFTMDGLDISFMEALRVGQEAGMMKSFDFSLGLDTQTLWCVLIGGAFMWINYFSFDQVQVQRFITSKDVRNIKKASIFSMVMIQVVYWAANILGVLFQQFYAVHPSTLDFGNANNIMIDFLLNYIPHGIKGIILAAIFAAAMSSIDSTLNSLSTVFVKDIYEPYITKKPDTPLKVTITFSAIFGVLVMIFVYFYLGEQTNSILLTIASVLAPFDALLAGIKINMFFNAKVNDRGMFWGAVVTAGLLVVIKQFFHPFYLWEAVYGSILCVIVTTIISRFMQDPEETERTRKYTYKAIKADMQNAKDIHGNSMQLLKIDKYGYMMIAFFVIQVIVLFWLEG